MCKLRSVEVSAVKRKSGDKEMRKRILRADADALVSGVKLERIAQRKSCCAVFTFS